MIPKNVAIARGKHTHTKGRVSRVVFISKYEVLIKSNKNEVCLPLQSGHACHESRHNRVSSIHHHQNMDGSSNGGSFLLNNLVPGVTWGYRHGTALDKTMKRVTPKIKREQTTLAVVSGRMYIPEQEGQLELSIDTQRNNAIYDQTQQEYQFPTPTRKHFFSNQQKKNINETHPRDQQWPG